MFRTLASRWEAISKRSSLLPKKTTSVFSFVLTHPAFRSFVLNCESGTMFSLGESNDFVNPSPACEFQQTHIKCIPFYHWRIVRNRKPVFKVQVQLVWGLVILSTMFNRVRALLMFALIMWARCDCLALFSSVLVYRGHGGCGVSPFSFSSFLRSFAVVGFRLQKSCLFSVVRQRP